MYYEVEMENQNASIIPVSFTNLEYYIYTSYGVASTSASAISQSKYHDIEVDTENFSKVSFTNVTTACVNAGVTNNASDIGVFVIGSNDDWATSEYIGEIRTLVNSNISNQSLEVDFSGYSRVKIRFGQKMAGTWNNGWETSFTIKLTVEEMILS